MFPVYIPRAPKWFPISLATAQHVNPLLQWDSQIPSMPQHSACTAHRIRSWDAGWQQGSTWAEGVFLASCNLLLIISTQGPQSQKEEDIFCCCLSHFEALFLLSMQALPKDVLHWFCDGFLQALQPAPALPGPPQGPCKRQLLLTLGSSVLCSHQQVCSAQLRSIQTALYRQHFYEDYIPELGSRNKPPN